MSPVFDELIEVMVVVVIKPEIFADLQQIRLRCKSKLLVEQVEFRD